MNQIFAAFLFYVAACASASAGDDRPLRDPFARPLATGSATPKAVEAPPPPLHLRAVILNGARSLASIDGDVVSAGDRLPGYTVLRIDARGVLVVAGGRQRLLVVDEIGRDAAQASPPHSTIAKDHL